MMLPQPPTWAISSVWALVLCLTWLCAAPAAADDLPEGGQVSRVKAMQLAAERNYGILIEAIDRDLALLSPDVARDPYIPVLQLDATLLDNDGIADDDDRRRQLLYGGEVRWRSPWGGLLSAGLSSADRISGLVTPHGASMAFAVAQSLMRDGWQAGAYTPVLEAEVAARIRRELFRDRLNGLLAEVEAAYWALAFAREDLEGRQRSLDRARRQFEDTRENIERGILADADIYIVEENVVIFEEQLTRAKESLTLAQSRLARLLQLEPGTTLVATDTLTGTDLAVPDLEQTVGDALEQSPSLAASRLEVRRANIRLAFESNRAMPVLDLEASLVLNGAGESRGGAWGEVLGAEGVDARVGVIFEVPLFGTSNKARVDRGRLEKERRLLSLKDDEARLRFSIQDLLTSLETLSSRLALAQRRVELAELKLDAQTDRYKNGISTLDEVVRFQRDLDGARLAQRRVRVDLLVAYSRLLEAKGVLHQSCGVEVR